MPAGVTPTGTCGLPRPERACEGGAVPHAASGLRVPSSRARHRIPKAALCGIGTILYPLHSALSTPIFKASQEPKGPTEASDHRPANKGPTEAAVYRPDNKGPAEAAGHRPARDRPRHLRRPRRRSGPPRVRGSARMRSAHQSLLSLFLNLFSWDMNSLSVKTVLWLSLHPKEWVRTAFCVALRALRKPSFSNRASYALVNSS